uniref:Uncharacterized protein n=1 Tax=Opuntia streptacantha TaxID=393608 RepID=A0A7C9CWF0_OPUST
MATGTILSVSSANRALNLNRNGSLQVVPSGQITKSPSSSKRLMFSASFSLSLDNATALMGEISSENLLMLYVTQLTFLPRATAMTTGSKTVLWLQTNRTPPWPFLGEKGGLPLTTSLIPKIL